MSFTGNEDHSISLSKAAEFTANYRQSAGQGAIIAGYFGETTLKNILNQDGCVGIRFYYGLDNNGDPKMVLVGADTDENDLIDGIIAEKSYPCPPYCSKQNQLNSN